MWAKPTVLIYKGGMALEFPSRGLMPFLSFTGVAEEAMKYYADVFGAKIEYIKYYEESQGGDVGKVINGVLDLGGTKVLFLDMSEEFPAPAFSWATSLLLTYPDEVSFDKTYEVLSKDGSVMMEPTQVQNIRKCCWVTDKFGVTWQLVWG